MKSIVQFNMPYIVSWLTKIMLKRVLPTLFFTFAVFLYGFAVVLIPTGVYAINSLNYKVEEDFIGGGGGEDASSSSHRSNDSIGGSAENGESASAGFGLKNGPKTTDEPTLTFSVNTGSVNLGALSNTLTRIGTATFSVLNYTSYGYTVQALGNPPDNGQHMLAGMSTSGSSAVGSEQFGINIVANTSPVVFGANPQQMPDVSFAFGMAAPGYNATNSFKYVPGDIIASAPKSSGRTDYTISYIGNISHNTPGGSYTGEQTLLVIGTY